MFKFYVMYLDELISVIVKLDIDIVFCVVNVFTKLQRKVREEINQNNNINAISSLMFTDLFEEYFI